MTVTRRTLITGGLTVLAGSAVASRVLAGQIEIEPATPAVVPEGPPVALGPTVASVAAELGYDQAKIVDFVTTQIAYEPYAGALRGANGTLWSRAGNSVDQAVLLGALLQESLIDYRFAFGAVPEDALPRLVQLSSRTADQVREYAMATFGAAATPRASGVTATTREPDTAAVADAEVEAWFARGEALLAEASASLDRQFGMIQDALSGAGIEIPGSTEAPIPPREISQHAWVQIADGPAWIDADPVFGDAVATPGVTLPALTLDETVPLLEADDLRHLVTMRLMVEEVRAGGLRRRTVVSLDGPSAAFVRRQFAVAALPPDDFAAIGLAIERGFSGKVSLLPMIVGGDISVVADAPIVFGSSGGFDEIFAADVEEAGPREGETTALFLEIDVVSPDRAKRTFSRTLVDRLADQRVSDTPDLAALQPVETVPFYEGKETIRELTDAHLVSVVSAAVPLLTQLEDGDNLFAGVGVVLPMLSGIREGYRGRIELDAGQISFFDGPNITLVSVALIEPSSDDPGVHLGVDLVHRQSRALLLTDSERGSLAAAAMRAGVLDQVAEAMTVVSLVADLPPEAVRPALSISAVFDTALAEGVPIVAVGEAGQLDAVESGRLSRTMLEHLLADDHVLILPERPVSIDGALRTGVWIVHRESGATRDMLDDGRGGMSVVVNSGRSYETTTGYARLLRILEVIKTAFTRLWKPLVCGAAIGALFIALSYGLTSGDTRALAALPAVAILAIDKVKSTCAAAL